MNTYTRPDNTLRPDNIEIGGYVYQVLVTDSVIYEVIGRTAKTVTVRTTRQALGADGLPLSKGTYPYISTAQTSNPDGEVITLRERKDGTYRIGNSRGVRALRHAEMETFEDGNEYASRYVDYSF